MPNDDSLMIAPTEEAGKENLPANEQDLLEKAMKDLENHNRKGIEVQVPTERKKISTDLPTLYKGLPVDRKKWTPGDWKRMKVINK